MKTVIIGIPAHNEERNIGKLLDCIVSQKGNEFKYEKVIVACDGCTDNTQSIVNSYKKEYPYIKLIDDGKRLGQEGRLNQFYKINTSDVFITFDADTVLADNSVVNEIVKAFNKPSIGVVGGSDTPNPFNQNFVQKVGTTWVDVWYEARHDFNGGVSVNNHKGCVSAVSKSLAKHLEIPKGIIGNDDYVYFSAKKMGYEFAFAKRAVVYYTIPSSLKEYFTQTTRFLSAKHKIAEYFGDWVYEEYKIPRNKKIKGLITVFLRSPFYLICVIIFQILQRIFKSYFQDSYKNGFWKTITTSK